MRKIKTLIVDDEPQAIVVIQKYAQMMPELNVVGTCSNAIEAFQKIKQQAVDLVFLDIKMPGLLGTDLLRSLQNPPRVIFTTAYAHFALEGYELNVVDYLLKPISLDRFLKAVDKVLLYFEIAPEPSPLPTTPVAKSNCLYFRVDRKMVKVNTADILWIESQKDYIKVVMKDRTITSKQKISTVYELLPEDKFIRIHRSFVVGKDKIDGYLQDSVEVAGTELPIGRLYKKLFLQQMNC